MGDVTSTCCQNTTQLQQMGITRQINMDKPIDQQVFVQQPFQQFSNQIKQTFKQASQSKFFVQPMQKISFNNDSNIWNQDKIITIIKKLKTIQKSQRSSIFQINTHSDTGKYSVYIKSLQSDNQIFQPHFHSSRNQEAQPFLHSQQTNKVFTGLFLIYFPNKQYFLGHLYQNNPTNGIFVFQPGCYYVGHIKDLTAQGQGKYQNKSNGYIYQGSWSKNMQHGKGKQFYSQNGDRFQGQFMYGSKFGMGVYRFHDGRVYEGYFYNGHSDGQGKLTVSNKQWYKGQWKLGSIQGKGQYHYPNGDVYYGDFENGIKSGKGRYVFSSGYEYDGEWFDGKMHGIGVIKQGYDEIQGEWVDGKRVA